MVKLFQKLATGLMWQIIDKFPIHFLSPKNVSQLVKWNFSIWYKNVLRLVKFQHLVSKCTKIGESEVKFWHLISEQPYLPFPCKKFGFETNCSKIGRLSSINSEETRWRLVCQVCLEYQREKERFSKLLGCMSAETLGERLNISSSYFKIDVWLLRDSL